jgi:ABC-2 type transport system permease protein
MMTVLQNAFANTSSTITFGKVLGIIIDILIPPLSPKEITFSVALGGLTRGVVSGLVVGVAIYILGKTFVPSLSFDIYNVGLMFFYLIFSSLALSLIGMIAGIFSDSFDQMSAITSYVITPLSFLSGTFYSIKNLPEFWQQVNHFNPFFYMIDGFRYSFTGRNDADIQTGMIYILGLNLALYTVTYLMLKKGYRIKS